MTRGVQRIAIRVDASRSIGTGHVIRCLTLARVLRRNGADIHFVCREHDGHLCDLIAAAGFKVTRLHTTSNDPKADPNAPAHFSWLGDTWANDAVLTKAALGHQEVDWLIVDHYALDARWEQQLRACANRIMVIDDLADRQHDCDLLLDQNFFSEGNTRYRGLLPDSATLLLGPSYALLQEDYAKFRRRVAPREGGLGRILVSFGGGDQLGLTLRTVEALLSLEGRKIGADVILSSNSPGFLTIKHLLLGQDVIHLHERVPSLAPYILAADLAIGAGGGTHWERMCLGLPSLVITMAENQRQIARELAERSLIVLLGEAAEVRAADIRAAVERVAREGVDATCSSRCMALVDGFGAERVAAVLGAGPTMPLVIRHGELRDEDLLLEWANDPITRANGFNPAPIPRDDHIRWYRARLRDPLGCRLFIAESVSGVPVGQVRFDEVGGEWEVSYAIAPAFRGRGVGRHMLETALREPDDLAATVIGRVKPDNAASRRIFETLGFVVRRQGSGFIIFERKLLH